MAHIKVSLAEAKNNLPKLIKAVESGRKVTICRRGVPVVDIVRTVMSGPERPKFGSLAGRVIIHDPDWWKAMTDKETNAFLDKLHLHF